jgi:hypothetical protein
MILVLEDSAPMPMSLTRILKNPGYDPPALRYKRNRVETIHLSVGAEGRQDGLLRRPGFARSLLAMTASMGQSPCRQV